MSGQSRWRRHPGVGLRRSCSARISPNLCPSDQSSHYEPCGSSAQTFVRTQQTEVFQICIAADIKQIPIGRCASGCGGRVCRSAIFSDKPASTHVTQNQARRQLRAPKISIVCAAVIGFANPYQSQLFQQPRVTNTVMASKRARLHSKRDRLQRVTLPHVRACPCTSGFFLCLPTLPSLCTLNNARAVTSARTAAQREPETVVASKEMDKDIITPASTVPPPTPRSSCLNTARPKPRLVPPLSSLTRDAMTGPFSLSRPLAGCVASSDAPRKRKAGG